MIEFCTYYRPKDRVWRIEAREADLVVGGAFLIIQKQVAKLGYISAKKEGIGSEVLEQVIICAKELGCTSLEGSFQPVPEAYSRALKMYENFGFIVDEKKQKILLNLNPTI